MVELDPEIVSVAEKFFDLIVNERITIHVRDGIQHVKDACSSGEKGKVWKFTN